MPVSSPLFSAVSDTKRFPVLFGTIAADVVVVGGGITGIMAAWRAAQNNQAVVLLEQHHLATGDTGYTTSFITRVPDTPLASLSEKYGLEFVRQVWQATTTAQAYLRRIVSEEKIDCDWVDCNSYNLSYAAHNKFLQAEWAVVKDIDPLAAFVTAADDPALQPPQVEAIRFLGEANFNVRKFIFGLMRRPGAQTIKVFEESLVSNIQKNGREIKVITKTGVVTAKRVIVATGLPPTALVEAQTLFTTSVTYAIAVHFHQGAPITNNNFWDTDTPYQYYRRLDEKTILLGGADHRLGRGPADGGGHPLHRPAQDKKEKSHDQLYRFVQQHWSGPSTLIDHWSGSLFSTVDGLPYIAAHPFYDGRVFLASGFIGSGMIMGTLSGMILGDLAAGIINPEAELFDFSRTGVTISPPKSVSGRTQLKTRYSPSILLWRWLLPVILLFIISVPAYIFFSARGGLRSFQGVDLRVFSLRIFPLVGLYAFTLVWLQLMIGANMDLLRRVYSWIESWHRKEGVFVFLFAWTHPILLLIGVGPTVYLARTFVTPQLVPFVWLGYFQLTLINLTVITALLRKKTWLKRHWHTIHYLNYITFTSIWIHSWFIGSDVQYSPLRYVWMFYAATAIVATIARITRARRSPAALTSTATATTRQSMPETSFVKVATLDQVTDGHPFCAAINDQQIAVFKFGDTIYAIDNICSHAGGPLCAGTQMGQTIECPLHQSVFDITTGAVKEGPATRPQKTYPVRIQGDNIEIKI